MPLRLDTVLAPERLRLRDQLVPSDRARGVEMAEEQLAHAHAALPEPAQRVLIEAGVPVLGGEVTAHPAAELRGHAVRRLAERAERLPAHLAGPGEQRVD